MEQKKLAPLYGRSIAPRFFRELGLSRQRMFQWASLSKVGAEDRSPNKTRLLSPQEIMSLGVLKELKGQLSISFKDQMGLIDFVRSEDTFERSILLWADGRVPILSSNLDDLHQIEDMDGAKVSKLLEHSQRAVVLNLQKPIITMLLATLRGGTQEQLECAQYLTASNALETKRREKRARRIELPITPHSKKEAERYILLKVTV